LKFETTYLVVIVLDCEYTLVLKLGIVKFISNLFKVITVLFLLLGCYACTDDDDNILTPPVTLDIIETLENRSSLSTLVTALDLADGDLVDLLKTEEGTYTIFAPTNDAFAQFVATNGFQPDASPKNDSLSLYYNVSSVTQVNGTAVVSESDIETTNGIIHIVESVIPLPNLNTFINADPNLSSLAEGLNCSEFEYATTLETDGPFSIFAPNNEAFEQLLDSNMDWNTISDIPKTVLKSALDLHILTNDNLRKMDFVSGAISTLGGNIFLEATSSPATLSDGSTPENVISSIESTDVQSTNGVIHFIDKVLLNPRP